MIKYLLTFCLLTIHFILYSATSTWIGTSNTNWSNPANWSLGAVPTGNDDVLIQTGGSIVVDGNFSVKNLTLNGQVFLEGSGSLTVNGILNWANPEAYTSGITLIIGPTGSFTLETIPQYTEGRGVGGDFIVNGNMTLKAGYFDASNVNFIVNGTLTWVYGNIYDNLEIGAEGTLIIEGSIEGYQRLVDDDLINNGLVKLKNGELRTAGGTLINNGTFVVEAQDNLFTGGFPALGSEGFINNGTMTVDANVQLVNMDVSFTNNGIVNNGTNALSNSTFLFNKGLTQNGVFKYGNLETSPYTLSYFNAGSVTSDLKKLLNNGQTSAYASSTFSRISQFDFYTGEFVSNIVLPSDADYKLGSLPVNLGYYGGWKQNVAMNITGKIELGYGNLYGDGEIVLQSQDGVWNGTNISLPFTVASNAVLTIGEAGQSFNNYMGSIGNGNTMTFKNLGTINVDGAGNVGVATSATFENFGDLNVNADFTLGSALSFPITGSVFENTGSINVAPSVATFNLGMELVNDANIDFGGASNFNVYALENNSFIQGQGGDFSTSFGAVSLKNGSVIDGFNDVAFLFCPSGNIEIAAIVSGYDRYSIQYSIDFSVSNNLDAAASYYFNNSIAAINSPLISDSITIVNANILGTGTISGGGIFNWTNGEIGLPIDLSSSAIAQISTDSIAIPYFPIPSALASFTNNGEITVLNGAFKIDAQLTNNGVFQFESAGDIAIEGSGNFENNGSLKNCSSNPILVSFEPSVVNNGTINGTGSYAFNGGITNNGILNPGCSPGHMVVYGDLSIGSAMNLEVMGNNALEIDHLKVIGRMTAGGTLNIIMPSGMSLTNTVELVDATSMQGSFNAINVPAGYTVSVVNNKLMLSSIALPVELLSFDAAVKGEAVKIDWATASEINNDRFDVMYSDDGYNFSKIQSVSGKGNTKSITEYSYLHTKPSNGINYYQLWQFDFDGKTSKSKVAKVFVENSVTVSLYPTTFSDGLNVNVSAPVQVSLEVITIEGRTIAQMNVTESGLINTSFWQPGIYFIKMDDGVKSKTVKVVKF